MRHAIALGLMQGPTELLPVSSSGHTVLVPALLGWPYARLEPDQAKAYEVALHAGAVAGILASARLRKRTGLRIDALGGRRDRRVLEDAALTGLTALPAVLGGLAFGELVERRLGSPRGVAAAQVVAGAALRASDRGPARRAEGDAGPLDALILGLGQAAALAPGVSRAGGTLIAARIRGFRHPDAALLSWRAALPVLLGATALKGARLARDGLPRELVASFAAGTASAFASTAACAPLAEVVGRRGALRPLAAYRVALGVSSLAVLSRRKSAARDR